MTHPSDPILDRGAGPPEVGAGGAGASGSAAWRAARTLIQHPVDPDRPTPRDAVSRACELTRPGSPGAAGPSLDPTALQAALVGLAEVAARDADWAKAARCLDWAVAMAPGPRLSFRLGVALFNLGRFDACLEALEAAARGPDFFERALTRIIKVHQRRRASDALLAACERLLRRHPGNVWAIRQLYTRHVILRDFTAAREWFDAAHRLDPVGHPWAYFELLRLERLGRLTDALAPYRVNLDPRAFTEEMKERLANLFYATGRFHPADLCAQAMLDQEAGQVIRATLSAATGRPKFDVAIDDIPATRAGRVARALQAYLAGAPDQSVAELDQVPERASDRLAIGNFRSLVASGRLLSNRLFAPVTVRPRDGEVLPAVNQLWVGEALSSIERLSIRSFIACGHEVHLYAYDRDLEVPDGCILEDAAEIMPRSEVFGHSAKTGRNAGSLAGFADLFRWKLIFEKGGAWADCDVVCLEPIRSHRMVSTELVRIEGVIVPGITNCFFAAERGEPALREAFEAVKRTNAEDLQWGEAGIHRMASLVAEQGWGDRLTSPSDICPIPSFRMIDALAGGIDCVSVIAASNCRAVHLYNEVMRDAGLDKNAPFPAGSLVAHLERRVARREGALRAARGQGRPS